MTARMARRLYTPALKDVSAQASVEADGRTDGVTAAECGGAVGLEAFRQAVRSLKEIRSLATALRERTRCAMISVRTAGNEATSEWADVIIQGHAFQRRCILVYAACL